MKKFLILTTAVFALAIPGAHANEAKKDKTMKITEYNRDAFEAGPAEYFTGNVTVGSHFAGEDEGYKGAIVNFEAGARTNWHTHPKGQTLVITEGEGRVQIEGEAVRVVKPGDIVWFPPGVKHWHGAAPGSAMSHIAIQSPDENDEVVNWLNPVSDEEYQADE